MPATEASDPQLSSAGQATGRRIVAWRVPRGTPRISWHLTRDPDGTEVVELAHSFTPDTVGNDEIVTSVSSLMTHEVLHGQWEFEEAASALIQTSAPSRSEAWACFYDNSLRALTDGRSQFAPIHRRAQSLLAGASVLEVGCSFGFFALQCAAQGRAVGACDISLGALSLLGEQARRVGLAVRTVVADVISLPFADSTFETVTLVHLLEHLEPRQVGTALREAARVASDRVVAAVPYEDTATDHFGHLQALTRRDLMAWGYQIEHRRARVFDEHGGWLVLDL